MQSKIQKDLDLQANQQPLQQKKQQEIEHSPQPISPQHLPQNTHQDLTQSAEDLKTQDFVMVTHRSVTFNKMLYPGAYDQIEIKVSLKPGVLPQQDPFLVKVIARCDVQSLNVLDQYVFSVRYYTQRLQFFQQIRFRIRQKTLDFFRVAVKMPAMKKPGLIKGTLLVQLQQSKPLQIPIQAQCNIPNIQALKPLYSEEHKISLIKLAIKRGVRPALIMFKNNSSAQLTLQVQIIGDGQHVLPYDLSVANPVIAVTPNQQFMVQLISKHMDDAKPPKYLIAHKALLLKIKCSCVYYCFPLEIVFMDVAISTFT